MLHKILTVVLDNAVSLIVFLFLIPIFLSKPSKSKTDQPVPFTYP